MSAEGGRLRKDNATREDSARVSFAPDSEPGRGVITAEEFFSDSSAGRQTARPPPPEYARGRPIQQQEPQRGSQRRLSAPPPAQGQAPAAPPTPAFVVPEQRVGKRVVVEDPAYLYTEEFPFTYVQKDRQHEEQLDLLPPDLEAQEAIVQMKDDEESKKQLMLSGPAATAIDNLDKKCARRHLAAIKDSIVTHEELHSFIFMKEEKDVDVLDLAGLENAPGVYHEVTQSCRLVFTSKNRLVFTQAKHSAEIGMPKMYGMASLLPCFHDYWSNRKWSSYYAAINASEVLQVFVKQTLETSYKISNCSFNDVLGVLCCPMGGTMHSEKNMTGMTQTMGDHDPRGCESRFDNTRFMRHALVIRYLDCASNRVLETIAYAHPDTPAANLFEMARSIDACITTRGTDLLKNKTLPTVLQPRPFYNGPPVAPLYKTASYRGTIFVLSVVALIFFAINTTSAVLMLFAVFLSVGGSYAGGDSGRKLTPKGPSWVPQLLSKVAPKLVVYGTSGVSLLIYVSAAWSGFTTLFVSATAASLAG